MFQTDNQTTQPPQMAPYQTMASAAASHLLAQQQQYGQVTAQHLHQQQQQQQQQQHQQPQQVLQAEQAAAAVAAGFAPNPAMAMAASAIVAGGQQQSVAKRIVKWVFSGDYLVLRDHPRGGPPPEYYVNFAYVQAPRFNRTPGEDGKTSVSEPWAWEAKEYLAKRLIGQEVVYRSEYNKGGAPGGQAAPGGPFGANANKEFGIIYLGDENIVETMVAEGLLEVRRTKAESPVLQQLIEAEEAAKAAGKGKWSSQAPIKRELLHEHPNPNQLKGKTFTGTVENVRNGGSIQVYLDLGVEQGVHKYLNASIMVSGIRSPDKNRATEAKFHDESRFFTESRLLNREVKVHIEKAERNSYLSTVLLGTNNLAEALLRQGMARCNDGSISLTKAPERLRAAEKEAKQKRLRIWENYVDSRGNLDSEAYEAKIVEIISGDSMMAENLATGEVKKIFLASIRLGAPVDRDRREREAAAAAAAREEASQNKQDNKNKQADSAPKQSSIPRIYDQPLLYHARELLRKKLLGKRALVRIEYIQPKSDSYPEKICCTVRPADQPKWNAAEALVSKGYASVIKYMSDDSQRASNIDGLLKAEQNALKTLTKDNKERQKDLAPLKVVDLCNDVGHCKKLLPFLSRTRKEAVVEFVYSASRLKLFLPKENNTLLNMVLAGVIVPREPDELKNASTAAAKALVHQRDVIIHINTMDKKGNFIGWVYYKDETTNKETSLNLQLVKLGYGQVRELSAGSASNELKAAESAAREKKLGLWLTYKEPERVEQPEVVRRPRDDDDQDSEEDVPVATNGVDGDDADNAGPSTSSGSHNNSSNNNNVARVVGWRKRRGKQWTVQLDGGRPKSRGVEQQA